jgi:transcriptional regulator with XRE-family HTH domain
MDEAKMRPVDLARAAEVSRASVSDWLNGKTKTMGGEPLALAALALGVNAVWLATGRGRMRVVSEPYDPEVQAVAEAIQSLSPPDRAHLQAVADSFVKSAQLIPWKEGDPGRRKGD